MLNLPPPSLYIPMEAMVGGGVGLAIKRKILYYCYYICTTPTTKKFN